MDNSKPTVTVVRTELEPLHVKLDIEVPVEDVQRVYRSTMTEFNRHARVPGFRPGKAPRKLLLGRYREEIAERATETLMREGLERALESEGVQPETTPRPDGDPPEFHEDRSFVFSVTFDVAPEFELPEYKGIRVSRDVSAVDDGSVDAVISDWLRQRARFAKVDRPARAGDLLKVTYSGTPDAGEEIPETAKFFLDAEDTWLALREPELLPGATAALEGAEAGSEREMTVTFPEEHGEKSLAGRTVVYRVTVSEVHSADVPDLSDELAKEVGLESADEVRDRVRANLEEEKKRNEERQVRAQILQAVCGGMTFPLPPAMLRRSTQTAFQNICQREMRAGATTDDLRGRHEELMKRSSETAVAELRRYYTLSKIADAEEIRVGQEELSDTILTFSRMEQVSPQVMLRRLRESGRLSDLVLNVRESKTIDRLVELAEISETAGS